MADYNTRLLGDPLVEHQFGTSIGLEERRGVIVPILQSPNDIQHRSLGRFNLFEYNQSYESRIVDSSIRPLISFSKSARGFAIYDIIANTEFTLTGKIRIDERLIDFNIHFDKNGNTSNAIVNGYYDVIGNSSVTLQVDLEYEDYTQGALGNDRIKAQLVFRYYGGTSPVQISTNVGLHSIGLYNGKASDPDSCDLSYLKMDDDYGNSLQYTKPILFRFTDGVLNPRYVADQAISTNNLRQSAIQFDNFDNLLLATSSDNFVPIPLGEAAHFLASTPVRTFDYTNESQYILDANSKFDDNQIGIISYYGDMIFERSNSNPQTQENPVLLTNFTNKHDGIRIKVINKAVSTNNQWGIGFDSSNRILVNPGMIAEFTLQWDSSTSQLRIVEDVYYYCASTLNN